MEPEIDDDALLVAAVDDPEAFAQFYRHHVRGVLAYFRRRVPDAETAADLTAETFAAALEGRRRYAPERGPAAAWLYGIARRRLIASQRRGRVERGARRRMGMARIELTDEMLERVEAIADAELARVDVALAAPTAVLAARAAGCTQGTEGGRAGRWARADRTTVLPSAAIGGTRQDCPG